MKYTEDKEKRLRLERFLKSFRKEKDRNNTAGQSLGIREIYEDGIMKTGKNRYSTSAEFRQRNFGILSQDDRDFVSAAWGRILDSFGEDAGFELTFINWKETGSGIKCRKTSETERLAAEYENMVNENIRNENGGMKRHMYMTFSVNAGNHEEAGEKLAPVYESLRTGFGKLGAEIKRLSGEERTRILYHLMNGEPPENADFSFEGMTKSGTLPADMLSPYCLDFDRASSFEISGKRAVTGFLRLGASDISKYFFGQLLMMDVPYVISIHARSYDAGTGLKQIKRKLTDINAMSIDEEKKAFRDGYDLSRIPEELSDLGEGARDLLSRIRDGGEKLYSASVSVMLTGDDDADLEKKTETIRAALRGAGFDLAPFTFRQEDGFVSALPIGTDRTETERYHTTKSLGAFIPFTGVRRKDTTPGAVYCGINKTTGETVTVDRTLLLNPNGLILGTPGAGKSFFAKREMAGAVFTSPDDILICDPESEYGNLVRALGGEVIRIAPDSESHINPMEIDLSEKGEDPVIMKCDFLLSMFEIIMGEEGMTAGEKSVLNMAVKRVYEKYSEKGGAMPVLEDLYNELLLEERPEGRHLASALEVYVKGSLSVFSHTGNVDRNKRILCFDIRDLGPGLTDLGMLIIENEIWERVRKNRTLGKRTRCYIDEMHLLLRRPQTASYTNEIWKRFRKWGGIPTGITQNVSDILKSDAAATIAENSDYIVMLRQSPGDKGLLKERLRLSDWMADEIVSAREGEGLLKCGNDFIPFEDHFPKNTMLYKVMTTKPGETAQ